MANFAHVLDGCVQNVYRGITDPATELPALHRAGVLLACADEVQPGWLVSSGVPGPPPDPPKLPTTQFRRKALFEELREKGDDEISVLGRTTEILLKQIAASTPPGARTPEFAALLSVVIGVQTRIPKNGG